MDSSPLTYTDLIKTGLVYHAGIKLYMNPKIKNYAGLAQFRKHHSLTCPNGILSSVKGRPFPNFDYEINVAWKCSGCGTRYDLQWDLGPTMPWSIDGMVMAEFLDGCVQLRRGTDPVLSLDRECVEELRRYFDIVMPEPKVLTCAFCGHKYPPGTESHGAHDPGQLQRLHDHIKICPKHPMRGIESLVKAQKVVIAELRANLQQLDEIVDGKGSASE